MLSNNRVAGLVVVFGILCECSSALAGGRVLADTFYGRVEDSNFFNDGQFWHANSLTIPNGTLENLSLDFGNGTQVARAFSFDAAQGELTFADGSFVRPLIFPGGYSTDARYAPISYWGYGELDPVYRDTNSEHSGRFTYDPATTLKAYQFRWNYVCPATADCTFDSANDPLMFFQAVFIEFDPETFLLELNYANGGFNGGLTYPLNEASAQIQIGSTSENVTYSEAEPNFLRTVGPDYCFRNGTEINCSALLEVPEPNELAMIITGLVALARVSSRNRFDRKTVVHSLV